MGIALRTALVAWMWLHAQTGHIQVLPNTHECEWIGHCISSPEPQDVPAVQETDATGLCWTVPNTEPADVQICGGKHVRWTCADKSRILLIAEDGTKHCVKFGDQSKQQATAQPLIDLTPRQETIWTDGKTGEPYRVYEDGRKEKLYNPAPKYCKWDGWGFQCGH